jgi:hypothetical protein
MLTLGKRRPAVIRWVGVIVVLTISVGCQQAAPPSKPLDVSKSVKEVEFLHDQVAKFCGGDQTVDGHESLHRVGMMLKELQEIDDRSGLDDAKRTDLAAAAKSMMNAYGDLDESIHAGTDFDYDSITATLSDNLQKMKTIAGQ